MIRMNLELVPGTRSKEKGSKWRATCGEHEAVSRFGATYALARVLRDAGFPEEPVEVYEGDKLSLRFGSLYRMAALTLSEPSQGLLHRRAFVPYDAPIRSQDSPPMRKSGSGGKEAASERDAA